MGTKGYKSTEFWMSLAAVLVGALMSSGLLEDGSQWAKIVGGVAAVLAALGYTAGRAYFKSTKLKADAMVGSSGAPAENP